MGVIREAFDAAWTDGPSLHPDMPRKSAIRGIGSTIEDVLNTTVAAATDGYPVQFETWAALSAVAPKKLGQMASVPTSDGGTHTDPVVGGTVNNSGTFRGATISGSTLGWKRIGNYQDLSAKADQTALDDVAAQVSAFETEAGNGVILSHPGITPADVAAPLRSDPNWMTADTENNNKIIGGVNLRSGVFDAFEARAFATVSHIVVMSQSLGLGAEARPPISTGKNPYGGKTFSIGYGTWLFNNFPQAPGSRADDLFEVVEMTDLVNGALIGETPANGMAAGLKSRIGGFFAGRDFTYTKPYFLFSNACEGSKLLTEIGPEDSSQNPLNGGTRGSGGYYKSTINDVWRGKAWALDRGMDYDVSAIIFMQGEDDAGLRRLYAWETAYTYDNLVNGYRGKLIALADSMNIDIGFVVGSSRRIPFITYQTSDTVIGEAQVQACEQGVDMFMASPTYYMPSARNSVWGSGAGRTYGSAIHLAADAERWLGEQIAKALAAIKLRGRRWTPLKRSAARKIDSTTIEVDLDGAQGALKVDTAFLAKAEGWGFEVWPDTPDDRIAGTATRIVPNSISVVGPSTIRLGLPSSIASGSWYLRYGGVFAADLGLTATVATVRNGPTIEGLPTKELVLSADITNALIPLFLEGVFNSVRGAVQMPVRGVYVEGGFTVLQGLAFEITGGTHTTGTVTFARWTGYGNIHDSDDSLSAYSWSGQSYHQRTGRYPLWNWLALFDNLRIS